ncbi:hypothetical protein [Mesoterricola silvestris]|uniref:Uncharacterized protein n=1 Tax=Mesoterricola silvestris TaxID=2927979 RepID=A0AA48GN06_9BACT|nr:hypothetical protein [Mesoterricola silvestris]BDU70995.1 hypothetical protein METEAL_01690 [Mesoterricola silvestris]
MIPRTVVFAVVCAALQGQAPLRVGGSVPGMLDLRSAAAADWVPGDSRDPAQVQAKIEAWSLRVAPLRGRDAVRILLPRGAGRVPLLLAASQALRAQDPGVVLYLGFDPQGEPLWDETAWGAVQGGALLAEDLGPDPAAWPGILARAQEFMPGRPWTLWLPSDPGARLGQLLGDGGRLVIPPGGPGAGLVVPPGFTDVEGGAGTLLLRDPRTGSERRWRFVQGAWSPVEAPRDRHEVQVTARDAYDVGALLARVRAERLREALAVRTQEADLAVDVHIQADQGPGGDLGFRFRSFQAAGEPEETLQEEVLLNGVRAKLKGGLQLPIVESRTSLAPPAALTLTERYRYQDGGEAGPGLRYILFKPADGDSTLHTGTLRVEEATGRILEERSSRSGLPGMVKSETRTLTYGEAEPGVWRLVKAVVFERWVSGGGVTQARRTMVYSGFRINGPGFAARREEARASDGTMLRATPDGLRYLARQKDGSRKVEDRPRTSGRLIGGILLFDPTLPLPVIPLAGLAYFDFDAFGKGIQLSGLTAGVFNTGQISVPNVGAGFDFAASTAFSLLSGTERPVRNGHLTDGEGVGRRSGNLLTALGHDLGWGFRLQARMNLRHDTYSRPWKGQHWTEGFVLPPSGWTRETTGELSWLSRGFQLKGYYGEGRRPDGVYGMPGALQDLQGPYARWGGSAGYDLELGRGSWLHGEAGVASGRGFDRFQALDVGGTGGSVRIAGIRNNAITADRLAYGKAALVLPTGPSLRLTLGLDQAWLRGLDDRKTYQVTGLSLAGDLPGFWWFTAVRVDLGVGLLSTLPGVRSCNGFVGFFRIF